MFFNCQHCGNLMPWDDMWAINCGHIFHSGCLEIICAGNGQCTTCLEEIVTDPVLLYPRLDQQPILEENENQEEINNDNVADDEEQEEQCQNCARMQAEIEDLKEELQDSMDVVDDLLEEKKKLSCKLE